MGKTRVALEKERKEIANLFRLQREQVLGVSQYQIAEFIGVERQTITIFECGDRSLRLEELPNYCWAYNLPIDKVIDLLKRQAFH